MAKFSGLLLRGFTCSMRTRMRFLHDADRRHGPAYWFWLAVVLGVGGVWRGWEDGVYEKHGQFEHFTWTCGIDVIAQAIGFGYVTASLVRQKVRPKEVDQGGPNPPAGEHVVSA